MQPVIQSFFDDFTHTITHVVIDPDTKACAIIDSVQDYDPKSGKTSTQHADRIIDFVKAEGLGVEWILETHVHADHLTAAPYLKRKLGGKIGIGDHIGDVQEIWNPIFNYKEGLKTDPKVFDHLFKDGEVFKIGSLSAKVMYTPGHTNVDVTYLIDGAAFVGDTLFMPDYGTARVDFPGGDARWLYQSIQRILSLPAETRIFMCHDYLPEGRSEYRWETNVGEARKNIHIAGITEDEFVVMREKRDKTLATPMLLYPALQINIRAGKFPEPEDNNTSYIKIPLSK